MRLQITGRKIFHLVVLPLVIAIAAFKFSLWAVAQPTDLNGLTVEDSQRAAAFQKVAPASSKIVLITFDDNTKARLGIPEAYPLPRSEYAKLIGLLDDAGAKVVLFDIEFAAPDAPESAVEDEEHNGALRRSLHPLKSLRVTFGVGPVESQTDANRLVPAGPFHKISVCQSTTSDEVRLGSLLPEEAATNNLLIGGFPIQRDTATNRQIVYAPLSAVLQYYDIPVSDLEARYDVGRLLAGSYEWSLNSNSAVEARWTKNVAAFKQYDILDAISLLRDPKQRQIFAKKLIIVGTHAANIDVHDTPAFGPTHGVDFVAQMTNTLLLPFSENLTYVPDSLFNCYCVLLGYLAVLAVRPRRAIVALPSIAGLVGGCFGLQVGAARSMSEILPTVVPVMVIALSAASGLVLGRYWTDYVDLSPPGETEQATVLFLDVKGSTVLLGKVGRVKYQLLLKELFEQYDPLVERFGGHIERTLGDGFMAVFRESGSQHHAVRCAACCRRLVEATADVGNRLGINVQVALGFETGMVGGHYVKEGGNRAWSSSGRVIHMSQRLQSLCGPLAISVAVGPVARHLISEDMNCAFVGRHPAKGFSEEVEVFELVVDTSSENVATNA